MAAGAVSPKRRDNDGIYPYDTKRGTRWGFVVDAGRKPNGAHGQCRHQGVTADEPSREHQDRIASRRSTHAA